MLLMILTARSNYLKLPNAFVATIANICTTISTNGKDMNMTASTAAV